MKVIKEFFVDDEFATWISTQYTNSYKGVITNQEHPVSYRTNKITISYEVDREITIKESDIDRVFSDKRIGFTERDIQLIKEKIFGDSNE